MATASLALAALVAPFWCSEAGAIQASGFLQVVPSNWGVLELGDEIEIALHVENRSTQTPSPVRLGQLATLVGAITVDLGCLDAACEVRDPSVLEFVPSGSNGCTASVASVTSCAMGDQGSIVVGVQSTTIPADGNVQLASVRVRVAALPVTIVRPLVRASTGPGSLTSCITPPDQGCVGAGLTGAARLSFVPNIPFREPLGSCGAACPSKIRFAKRSDRLDLLELHGVASVGNLVRITGTRIEVSLANDAFGEIFAATLPPGAITPRDNLFVFDDPEARLLGGVEHLRIAPLGVGSDSYRIDLRAFGDFANLASQSAMTAILAFGDRELAATGDWTPKAYGWQLHVP